MSVWDVIGLAVGIVGCLAGVVGTWVGVVGWRALKRADTTETRVALLEAVLAYEAALTPYRERFLSPGLTSRPGDHELILEHLPALTTARDRLRVALERAKPDAFRFCRRLAELEIRRFNGPNVGRLVNAVMAARAEAVSGGGKPPIPDGENYEIVSVAPSKLLT